MTLLTVCAWFSVPPVFAQSTVEDLYAVTSDKKLLRVDVQTGAGSLVTNLNVSGSPFGLASVKYPHGESAELWVVTTANYLHRLEPDSGKLFTTNGLLLPFGNGGDLALGSFFSGRTFLAQTISSTGSFVLVNQFTGTSTPVGPLSPRMEGLDVSYAGNLYGMSGGSSPSFYLIDRTNGATTLIGSLGISVSGAQSGGLAINGASGEIYAAISTSGSSSLYRLASSGAAALVGPIGFPNVSGLAFHVRRPGPLTISRQGTNVFVSWPLTNGGYLWRRTNITSLGTWDFNTTFRATNRMEIFYLSPHPPL